MTVTTRVRRGKWFQGADTTFQFQVEHGAGEDPEAWEYEMVIRRPSLSCPGQSDPGDGALLLSRTAATVTPVSDLSALVEVDVERADTLDWQPDDYYVTLWRTDDGSDRPLSVILYAHLTAAARQSGP